MKDFDKWNEMKKVLYSPSEPAKYYHEREIWWCAVGINVGYEYDGTGVAYERPVLILRALSIRTCVVLPLTTSSKDHHFRIPIGMVAGSKASVIISQIKVIDVARLSNRICRLDEEVFQGVRKSVKDLL